MKLLKAVNSALSSRTAIFTFSSLLGLTAGVMALSALPAQAGTVLEDAAVGAGVGLGTGLIFGERVGVDDAVNGAAAGAACNVANAALHEEGDRNLLEDVAVGAVTAGSVGTLTNDDSFLSNAAQGAAACTVIHVLD